jgi:hypothetical protein
MEQTSQKGNVIKNIYLYLVSFVALMMIVISGATIINSVLKMYVFKNANNYYSYPAPGCDGNVVVGQPVVSAEQCAKQAEINAERQEENAKYNFQHQASILPCTTLVTTDVSACYSHK